MGVQLHMHFLDAIRLRHIVAAHYPSGNTSKHELRFRVYRHMSPCPCFDITLST